LKPAKNSGAFGGGLLGGLRFAVLAVRRPGFDPYSKEQARNEAPPGDAARAQSC